MNYPMIRVIMPDGTVHTFRCGLTVLSGLINNPGWARIERTDIPQPAPMIEDSNDG